MQGAHITTSTSKENHWTNSNSSKNKGFLQGVQNARHLLCKLDRSIKKTSKYEALLLQCKATHAHSHVNEHNSSQLEVQESMTSKTAEEPSTSRSPIDLAVSWSTMSIVCLQYQYEELSKRYETLLKAHDERCNALNARDASLERLRKRVKEAQEQLASTHAAMLSVGEKYLNLRRKKMMQKYWYEDRVERLLDKLWRMSSEVERARLELDEQLARSLTYDHDTAITLLLNEIQKCNVLVLENIRLKIEIEELLSNKRFL